MTDLSEISIKAKNFKCFGDEPQGFDTIHPLNILVGKNNSGKSTLIDMVEYAVSPYEIQMLGHKKRTPQILIDVPLIANYILPYFRKDTSDVKLGNHYNHATLWLGQKITVEILKDKGTKFVSISGKQITDSTQGLWANVGTRVKNPFTNKIFRRLLSERDIVPEEDGHSALKNNGEGATTVIQQIINKRKYDRSLVEINLLEALNEVFNPESSFNNIRTEQLDDGHRWEILLEEEGKGAIPLSDSGSGLKTVILVLINLILLPVWDGKKLENYIFAFEELENNLHPALQRRLLRYIHEKATKEKCHVFLSTHSNVIIDMFSKDKGTQILHVTHNGDCAKVKCVVDYADNRGILDDLDVRASDLLQSNSVVWVEGPSDRIYFNRFIELWSDGKLREGTHYQCVFYGGRLLAHIDAKEPDDAKDISILNVNKNAIILIDSDKKASQSHINKTKKRVVKEIKDNDGLAWVTKGREIENYVPLGAFKAYYCKDKLEPLGKFDEISDYLNNIKKKDGDRFLRSKVLFAENIAHHITKEMLETHLDIKEKMDAVCEKIRQWNKIDS